MDEIRKFTIRGAGQQEITLQLNPHKKVEDWKEEIQQATSIFFEILTRRVPGGVWDGIKQLMDVYLNEHPIFHTDDDFNKFVEKVLNEQ